MTLEQLMSGLEACGSEKTRKSNRRRGAHEPAFGVTVKDLKPLAGAVGFDQEMAEALYSTGNYDAMYLAGMVADVSRMTEADFDRWADNAKSLMAAGFIVAVSLVEAPFAQTLADRWVRSGHPLRVYAGWNAWAWILGATPDKALDEARIRALLAFAAEHPVEDTPLWQAISQFTAAVGVSYLPLHAEALALAETWGTVADAPAACQPNSALTAIRTALEKNKIGFKRRHARC